MNQTEPGDAREMAGTRDSTRTDAIRFLIVDGDPDEAERIAGLLRQAFGAVTIVRAGRQDALELALERSEFHLVLTADQLPWAGGLDILRAVHARHRVPVLMVSRHVVPRPATAAA